eukprot:367308_1
MLQRTLNGFYLWCCKWKLTLNPSKCFAMSITKTKEISHKWIPRTTCANCGQRSFDPSICNEHSLMTLVPNHRIYHINGRKLTTVHTFKYLGLIIDDDLNFNHHENQVLQKMQKQYNHLYFLTATGINLHPKSIISLYKQKSRAYIEYASPHWFHFASDDIQTMQNKYLRLAAPTKRSTPLDLLHN